VTKFNHHRQVEHSTRGKLNAEARQEQAREEWRAIRAAEQRRARRIIERHADDVRFFADLRARRRQLSRAQVGAVLRIAQERGWSTSLDPSSSRPPALSPAERDAYKRLQEHQERRARTVLSDGCHKTHQRP